MPLYGFGEDGAMFERLTMHTPQAGTVVANGIVYVTTAYQLPSVPDISHLLTEDETRVENFPSEWDGTFAGRHDTWLRWCDRQGVVIPTGAERADTERQRAERLAQKLRELEVNPDRL
jgi:hypothetical protein